MIARVLSLAAVSLISACSTLSPAPATSSGAASARFCEQPETYSALQQDRLFQFAEQVRRELNAAGTDAAIISRTGIDLQRLGIRFTHSGIAVKPDNPTGDTSWTIRQLYYACDEARPRLYDQGIGGFLFGSDNPGIRHVSIVLPSPVNNKALQQSARTNPLALRLLGARYSANAYPYSTAYQNCNQWVIEMLAVAWGRLSQSVNLRADAQGWLRWRQYRPRPIELGSHWLKFAVMMSPMVRLDDHPEPQRDGLSFAVSLPRTIETFVREHDARSKRIELCHNDKAIVIRNGWEPIAPGCQPEMGDQVVPL